MTELSMRIIDIVKQVPRGRVATYGQIAAMAGAPRAPRAVVQVLKKYSDDYQLPWHRILSSGGYIKTPASGRYLQKKMLEEEGIIFKGSNQVSLTDYLWDMKSVR